MPAGSLQAIVLKSRAGDLDLSAGPVLAGILNVTPDSFYDGGRYPAAPAAVAHGLAMLGAGACWVDVGGMSTRPGSDEVPVEEEIRRVSAVVEELARRAPPGSWISIDTYRSVVAEAALERGACAVNDVSGFGLDPAMCDLVVSARCPVVINHMKGTPRTMQIQPAYDSVLDELMVFFESRLDRFVKAGGDERQVLIDPGIGFGKTLDHNLEILRGLDRLHDLGRPVFLGCSRKSFIERLAGASPEHRLPGSLAAAGWAALKGVHVLRVHDVPETAQFLTVLCALRRM